MPNFSCIAKQILVNFVIKISFLHTIHFKASKMDQTIEYGEFRGFPKIIQKSFWGIIGDGES